MVTDTSDLLIAELNLCKPAQKVSSPLYRSVATYRSLESEETSKSSSAEKQAVVHHKHHTPMYFMIMVVTDEQVRHDTEDILAGCRLHSQSPPDRTDQNSWSNEQNLPCVTEDVSE